MKRRIYATICLFVIAVFSLVGCGGKVADKTNVEPTESVVEENVQDDVSDEIKEIILSRNLFFKRGFSSKSDKYRGLEAI